MGNVSVAKSPTLGGRVAAAGGTVSFETWMDLALHDPEAGYYARNVRDVGRRGDFATASTLHPALGEAVAAWAAERKRTIAAPLGRWSLVEVGPGTGALAETVLARLPVLAKRTVRLRLVETSPVLREAQRARLGDRATWHETLGDALEAGGGRAVVYASELLDAFPVRVLRASRGGWEELEISLRGKERRGEPGISSNGEEWREGWRPASWNAAGGEPARFSALSRPWPEGQRVEIASAARLFLHSLKSLLLPGSSLLLLDYGDTIDRLYAGRPRGTVRGYAHHVRLEPPELYRWGGKADVTADVNFTDVAAWAAEAGFAVSPLEAQGAFLERHVRGAAVRAARESALAFLLDPRGAGSAFKVLELFSERRSARAPAALRLRARRAGKALFTS